MRKLKTIGLALVMALALSTAATSTASAEPFALHSEVQHTNLTGAQTATHQFTTDAGTATCKAVEFKGTMLGEEVEEAPVTPTYKECTADPSDLAVDVVMDSCKYVLTPETKAGSTYNAELAIACETGDSITILVTAFGSAVCTIHIPPQVLGGVTLSEAAEGDVTVVAESSGIEYDQTGGLGCSTAENTTNGTYKGSAVIAGSLAGVPIDIGMAQKVPVISIDSPIQYKKEGEAKTINVYNLTKTAFAKQIVFVASENDNEFEIVANSNTCVNGIKAEGSCKLELKCKKASGKPAHLIAKTQPPDTPGTTAATLEGC